MCNLYRMTKGVDEVANWFDITNALDGANLDDEVYPGYPGLVITSSRLRSMIWGFPMSFKSKRSGQPLKPKPVNNARSDKLDHYPWEASFRDQRCLIPLTAWCEAEGPKGQMTRTWLGLPDTELFAVAGRWRDSEEWGPVHSMVMTAACVDMDGIHDRMPVVLSQQAAEVWQNGSMEEARSLCVPWSGRLMIERTGDPWRKA